MRSVIFCALLFAYATEAYKILVVFPFPSRSHAILGDGVVRNLLNAGHEVTYITPYLKDKVHPNLRQVDVSANELSKPTVNIKKIMDKEEDVFNPFKFFNITLSVHLTTLQNDNVQKLMLDPNVSFDLVIVEWFFSELYAGFAAVFNCPYIWFSSVEPHSAILSLIDESLNPAYNSNLMSSITPPFTFVQRVQELFLHVSSELLKTFYFSGIDRSEYEKLFGPILKKRGRPLPDFEELKYNASLVLGNSHVSMGIATRLPQSYKPIGGYHIDSNVKPLPDDLKKLMDNAKHGVIYFSMGSNLKSMEMPVQLKQSLVKMFGTLKQTVLWKFEERLPGLPSNVHILDWAPQPSILAHPNCVLFITHGGLLSSTETLYFGKPIIGIPVFADQFTNVERTVQKGFGLKVDLSYDMIDEMKAAIDEVLHNPKYMNKAKELSLIYHHRPTQPGPELIHWSEHVVRTQGAPHLRSPALNVPFYQKAYLDLAALILLIIIGLRSIFKYICSKWCQPKAKNVTKNKKNK